MISNMNPYKLSETSFSAHVLYSSGYQSPGLSLSLQVKIKKRTENAIIKKENKDLI